MLQDPSIEMILNITTPGAHAGVAQAALEAGKSVYNEKPLTIARAEGRKLSRPQSNASCWSGVRRTLSWGWPTDLPEADRRWLDRHPGRRNGLYALSRARKLASSPEFYYQVGGGPMFDMGPYYLTALVALMGPARRVTGSTRITFPERTITSQPQFGKKITVEVPTHVAGVLEFQNGAIATIITSFDVWTAEVPRIEIYGTGGTFKRPRSERLRRPVRVRRAGAADWSDIPLTHGYARNSRSVGLADMAYALRTGRKARASGELAYHVLDIMHAVHDSARDGKHVELESTCSPAGPLALGVA